MNRVIWKFPLQPGPNMLNVPKGFGALFIKIGDQDGVPTFWTDVDPDADRKGLELHCIGTGQPFPSEGLEHMGTAVGPLWVWHVFKRRYVG